MDYSVAQTDAKAENDPTAADAIEGTAVLVPEESEEEAEEAKEMTAKVAELEAEKAKTAEVAVDDGPCVIFWTVTT